MLCIWCKILGHGILYCDKRLAGEPMVCYPGEPALEYTEDFDPIGYQMEFAHLYPRPDSMASTGSAPPQPAPPQQPRPPPTAPPHMTTGQTMQGNAQGAL